MNKLIAKRLFLSIMIPLIWLIILLPVTANGVLVRTDLKGMGIMIKNGYFEGVLMAPLSIIPNVVGGDSRGYFEVIIITVILIMIIGWFISLIKIIKNPKWWLWLIYTVICSIYLFLGSSMYSIHYF